MTQLYIILFILVLIYNIIKLYCEAKQTVLARKGAPVEEINRYDFIRYRNKVLKRIIPPAFLPRSIKEYRMETILQKQKNFEERLGRIDGR